MNADAGHFRYFGFYKALFDFLIAPPSVEPDIIFVGQNVMTDRYEVIFRYSKNYQKMMRLTPQAYEAYYACARGGMPTDAYNHLRSVITRIRSKVDNVLADITCRDPYKPVKVVNRYKLLVDRTKVFERKYLDPQMREYKDVPMKG